MNDEARNREGIFSCFFKNKSRSQQVPICEVHWEGANEQTAYSICYKICKVGGCVGFSCPLFVPSPFWAANFQGKSFIFSQIFYFACSGIFCFTAIDFFSQVVSDFLKCPPITHNNPPERPLFRAQPLNLVPFFRLRRPHPSAQLLAVSQRGRGKGKARVGRRIDEIAHRDPVILPKLGVLNLWGLPVLWFNLVRAKVGHYRHQTPRPVAGHPVQGPMPKGAGVAR